MLFSNALRGITFGVAVVVGRGGSSSEMPIVAFSGMHWGEFDRLVTGMTDVSVDRVAISLPVDSNELRINF